MKENIFHQHVGGTRRKDIRYIRIEPAPEIRRLIVLIRQKNGLTNGEIARRLGVSGATLSMAAGGRAGTRLNRRGSSTTKEILNGLDKLLDE